jgi:tripartite-type tricarboxylate transporter receptor subunit TctC
MEKMKRYAIYYAPEEGPFAQAAAAWLGWDPITNTPEQFTAQIKAELAIWADVVKKSGARID